jgi:hypothetical protein
MNDALTTFDAETTTLAASEAALLAGEAAFAADMARAARTVRWDDGQDDPRDVE